VGRTPWTLYKDDIVYFDRYTRYYLIHEIFVFRFKDFIVYTVLGRNAQDL
jgi:hypothetical protein